MPMGIGIWYNPRTAKVFNFGVFDTHDNWLRNPANVIELGLSEETKHLLSGISSAEPRAMDLIRAAAVYDGMVRMRDYRDRISVQFRAVGDLRDLLAGIHTVLADLFGPLSLVTLHNMATDESISLSITEMGQRLLDNSLVLVREHAAVSVGDIPGGVMIMKSIEDRLCRIRAEQSEAHGRAP